MASALNCEKTSPRTLAKKEQAAVSRQRTFSHYSPENFDQKQDDCRPLPILVFSVSLSKTKLEGRNFEIAEVIEAESKALLNTENATSRKHFQNGGNTHASSQ
jgi:hypothetical protein